MAYTPDSPFVLNSSGLVSYPIWPLPGTNGSNVSAIKVASPLPGQALAIPGSGIVSVDNVSGKQGSIRVAYTTGASGSARALAMLVQSSSVMLGVAIDSSNRPYAILKDAYGTTVGVSSNTGVPAVASGVRGEATLSWDSKGVVLNGRYASFVSGTLAANWTTAPVAAWDHLTPTSLYVGTALGALGLSVFNGTVSYVEVGNLVAALPSGTDAAEVMQITGSFAGAATVSSDADVTTP